MKKNLVWTGFDSKFIRSEVSSFELATITAQSNFNFLSSGKKDPQTFLLIVVNFCLNHSFASGI